VVSYKKAWLLFLIAIVVLAGAASAAELQYKNYIAGSYVNQDSKAIISVLNPADSAATTELFIYYEKNNSRKVDLKAEPKSLLIIDLANYASAGAMFGAVISSDKPVYASHVQYDGTYSAGFGSNAATKPGFVWYFGEGYTSGMVKTYLYLLNPNEKVANVGVTLYYEDGQKKTFNIEMPALKQMTLDLKERTMPEKRFGIKVTSTAQIVAETANYNKHFSAGTGGLGSPMLSKKWYFADGYTSTQATEFINIMNPSLDTSHFKITFYYDDGKTSSFDDTLSPGSKKMIMLNNYVEQTRWYSTIVESDVDIAAEMAHYDDDYSAGNGGVGATAPLGKMYFTGGIASDDIKSFIAVFNPSPTDAELKLTFYYNDGQTKTLSTTAKALARSTIDLNAQATSNRNFAVLLESTQPLVAEQVVYNKKQSSGYSMYGMPEIAVAEEKKADEQKAAQTPPQETAAPKTEGYTLESEEKASSTSFGEEMGDNLLDVTKYRYMYNNKDVFAWHFIYTREQPAIKAASSALSGSMFKMLELSPAEISGTVAHYFVSEKSEGYIVQKGQNLYVFVTEKGNSQAAYGLAELYLAGNPPKKKPFSITTILLMLLGLIVIVLVIRKIFRKFGTTEEERIIKAAVKKKEAKQKAPKQKPVPAKKEAHAKHKAEKTEEKAEEQPKHEKHKEEKHEAKEEKHKKPAPQHKAHPKEAEKPALKISEKPDADKTAQDLLDEAEEIPDYEDVFRHVNRDMDEIKPK
jgi:cell division septation protein DedD